ncbi:MAG: arginine--tRNA ligase [Deltaproteobacteria bacterium CG03_land_8_20_14_0_80_45_14]|nr:MAG: arginine--tRNA ligase [Deltaproteobacteria bacterium CG03_land_8_20_14_0_80_45_14]
MIREGVARVLKELLNIEEIPFNVPPQQELGDFSSAVCLSMAKQRRQSPMKIAQELAERLKSKLPPYMKDIGVSPPGYLNFIVDWPALAQDLIPRILQEGELFGKPVSQPGKKVFIEHTSVNPNKAMHIGHLRNSVLGDTVARVLKWSGFSTEVCNYIDDTGLQVVDVVTALLYLAPPSFTEGSDFKAIWGKFPADQPFDYFCWDLYARFQNELEKNPSLLEKREEVLHKIEGEIHPIAGFAKELATKIVQSHLETVAQLSIFYDLLNWESDIIARGFWETTFELLKGKGALRFETEGPNEGCWVVPFGGIVETAEGMKSLDKILVRSNGSLTYTGKDVAYQLWKFGLLKKDFLYKRWGSQANGEMLWTTAKEGEPGEKLSKSFGHAEMVINVIDTRQGYPQQVVVECLRQMGFKKEANKSIHMAYEVVNLSQQSARLLGASRSRLGMEETEEKKSYAMSGRSGTGVKAKDFIQMVKQKVIEKADHPLKESVASTLASAAIRYYLLKFTLESQIVFDFDEALKTTGDTGVYLEYAHARACSILRKAKEQKIDLQWRKDCIPKQLTETERGLLDGLSKFSSAVSKTGKTLRVSQLTEYAFDLATSFSNFYERPDPGADVQTPFIHLRDQELQTFRLSLVWAFQKVMGNMLNLMGMPMLERI